MSNRRAIRLTAGRELGERLRSRAFRVSLALQVLAVLAIVVISALTGGDDTKSYDVGAVGPESTRLVQGLASRTSEQVAVSAEEVSDEAAASSGVADGDLDAALVDGRLLTSSDTDEALSALIQEAAGREEAARILKDAGVEGADAAMVLNPPPLPTEEVGQDRGAAQGIAFVGTLLLYVGILGAGFLVTSAIVEEKTSRVVELVLSAIRPSQLLAGKVLGIGLIGLIQLGLTALVGIGAALLTGQVDLPSSTPQTVVVVLVYFLLGYALYACAFAVAGAIVSRQEDVGSVTTPLTVVLVAGYIASISIIDDPGGTLATVCTFLPPIAPLIVPARVAVEGVPAGELAASIALMLAAIGALIWLAARVYERGVLRVGAPLKLIEGLKLARR